MGKIIGDTPLIKIDYIFNGIKNSFYAKLEWYNLTGSLKDRIVNHIILKSKKEKILREGQTIVETTSGNTGISLAALGARYNHKVVIFMPDTVSKERVDIIKSYGAQVIIVKKSDGGFNKCLKLAKMYAKENKAFLLDQFNNELNIEAHYLSTGKEITNKLPKVDFFVSGVGSGGTAFGVIKRLKEHNNTKLIVVEPNESPLLNKNIVANHKIEGIGDEFVPGIVEKSLIDKYINVSSDDAIKIAQKLSKELGLGCGISSGANALASILINKENSIVATIFSDDLKKYLSTDLTKEIKNYSDLIDNIKFINYSVI